MSRLACLTALGALALAAPAAAQRAGIIDIGGGLRYVRFDQGLGMSGHVGIGGHVALFVRPALAFEVDVAWTSTTGPGGASTTYTPAHFWLVYHTPVRDHLEAVVGGGYVRNWYGAPYRWSDGGISAVLGVRYPLSERVSLRMNTAGDFMMDTDSNSPFAFWHGNLGVQVGASVRLNR